jgi:hypothetical protein
LFALEEKRLSKNNSFFAAISFPRNCVSLNRESSFASRCENELRC